MSSDNFTDFRLQKLTGGNCSLALLNGYPLHGKAPGQASLKADVHGL